MSDDFGIHQARADQLRALADERDFVVDSRTPDREVLGVRLRDVYRDTAGELWEVVALIDQPQAVFESVRGGVRLTSVIGCPAMREKFPAGPLRDQVHRDGLAWCGGCGRATSRGYTHDADCPFHPLAKGMPA